MRDLAIRLGREYRTGYGVSNLKTFKQFYLAYTHPGGQQEGHAVRGLLPATAGASANRKGRGVTGPSPAAFMPVPILGPKELADWYPGQQPGSRRPRSLGGSPSGSAGAGLAQSAGGMQTRLPASPPSGAKNTGKPDRPGA